MATKKQIEANRRNAKRSTGPRSAEGKAKSRRNALKTGLYAQGMTIGSELASKLELLEAQFTAEYQPATPSERSLVDQLIHCEWMLRRLRWVETEVWKAVTKKMSSDDFRLTAWGCGFIQEPALGRLHRQRAATQHAFRETLAELRRVQAARSTGESPVIPESLPDPVREPLEPLDSEADYPEIGFVPSINPTAPTGDQGLILDSLDS